MPDTMSKIVDQLLAFSDSQIDASARAKIALWSRPPTALQILEVLDDCIHGALASGFVVGTMQVLYELCCKAEGTTHAQLAPLAVWRDR